LKILDEYSEPPATGNVPGSGDLHRTICLNRSVPRARGNFSMSRGYTLSADGTSTRSSGSNELHRVLSSRAGRRCAVRVQPIQGDVVKNAVYRNRLERAVFGVRPTQRMSRIQAKPELVSRRASSRWSAVGFAAASRTPRGAAQNRGFSVQFALDAVSPSVVNPGGACGSAL